MKSINHILGPVLIIMSVLSFLWCLQASAQEKQGKDKSIRVKIAKNKSGDVIIDTVYTIKIKDLENAEFKKVLQQILVEELEGDVAADLLKDVFISIDVDDDVESDTDIDIDIDADDKAVSWSIKSDKEGKKVMYINKDEDNERIWIISGKDKIDLEDGHIYIMKTEGDSNEITLKSKYFAKDDGEHVIVYSIDEDGGQTYRIAVKSGKDKESLINIYKMDGDSETRTIIIKSLMNERLEEEDMATLEKAGIQLTDQELKLDDIIFFPNPNQGRFTLSFSTEAKGNLNIKIIDTNGKLVHEESYSNFTGKFNKDIDLTENSKGTYFLVIQHGQDVAAHKIIYK